MKKVLFATTALVASAGIASAQGVELSGSAEMGIVGGSRYADEVQFWHDLDIRFTLSGETDNGLTFGAIIDLDELNGDDINATKGGRCQLAAAGAPGNGRLGGHCPDEENDAAVFLSGNFGTITLGDTDGAFDWALQDLDIIGDINDSNTSHAGFNGNGGLDETFDGQVARYDYSFGDFAFAVSAELDDTGVGDPVFGIGGKYKGDLGGVTLGVGLGYQTDGTFDIIGISLDASFAGGFRGVINYSDLDGKGGKDSHMGVGLFYTMDAISVGVNYGVFDLVGPGEDSGFGLAANYDLGGGAVVQFGYGNSDPAGPGSTDSFSLGVAMSF